MLNFGSSVLKHVHTRLKHHCMLRARHHPANSALQAPLFCFMAGEYRSVGGGDMQSDTLQKALRLRCTTAAALQCFAQNRNFVACNVIGVVLRSTVLCATVKSLKSWTSLVS